jgi:hypothetical protein
MPEPQTADERKARMKKLNAAALAAKMELHDLSEELPTGWDQILEVAKKAYDAYQALDAAKKAQAAN